MSHDAEGLNGSGEVLMAGSSSELQGDILRVCGLLSGACLRGLTISVFILSGAGSLAFICVRAADGATCV